MAPTLVLLMASSFAGTDAALPDSPRVTPVVRVIREVEPCVAAVFCLMDDHRILSGSGTIIHPDGFILTNNHVVAKQTGYVLLQSDRPRKYRVIGRMPEKDIAVIHIEAGRKLPTVPLGHSQDTITGEPVIVAGNPGGRGITFTSGILSSRRFLAGGPNALIMTNYRNSARETFLQFDAASNPGNSGGPLINMEGKLIGIVSGGIPDEENIGWAIPIDRVRQFFHRAVDPEVHLGFVAGIELDPLEDAARVTEVKANSPAAAAGLKKNDVIVAVNGQTLRLAADWWLALSNQDAGKQLDLLVQRGKDQLGLKLTPAPMPYSPAVKVESPKPGLHYRFYHGQFEKVPAFDSLKPVNEGIVSTVELDSIRDDRAEYFGVQLTGYLQIPSDGLYRLIVVSDDGSLLYVDGALVIENDGDHPPQPMSRWLRLAQGLHAIRLDYFQGASGCSLQFLIESEDEPKPVAADWLFHKP